MPVCGIALTTRTWTGSPLTARSDFLAFGVNATRTQSVPCDRNRFAGFERRHSKTSCQVPALEAVSPITRSVGTRWLKHNLVPTTLQMIFGSSRVLAELELPYGDGFTAITLPKVVQLRGCRNTRKLFTPSFVDLHEHGWHTLLAMAAGERGGSKCFAAGWAQPTSLCADEQHDESGDRLQRRLGASCSLIAWIPRGGNVSETFSRRLGHMIGQG